MTEGRHDLKVELREALIKEYLGPHGALPSGEALFDLASVVIAAFLNL